MDKEVKMFIDGEEVDLYDYMSVAEPLRQGDFFYKQDGKWYLHKVIFSNVWERKKIEKLEKKKFINGAFDGEIDWLQEYKLEDIANKLNEVIEVINERTL